MQSVKLSLKLLSKSGEEKWFSTSVEVLVEKGPVKITKHPYGETVQEGGSCGFIARADNTDSRHWFFTKGGVVVGVSDQFHIPVKFIGVGEGIDDLKVFDKQEFVEQLFAPEDLK